MNLAIYLAGRSPKSGGAHTFENNILLSLQEIDTPHQLFIFSQCNLSFSDPKKSIQFVDLNPRNTFKRKIWKESYRLLKKTKFLHGSYDSQQLGTQLKTHKIDFIWFATDKVEEVDVPAIYTVWDLNHRVNPFFPEVSAQGTWEKRENFYRRILPRASYVLTGAEAGRQELIHFYNILEERIKVVPLPTPQFKATELELSINLEKEYGITKDYLFYPAVFWPHKNHIRILEAMNILKNQYRLNFDVVFVGADGGNLNYIKTQAKIMGVAEVIRFLDFVSKDVLVALYKNAFALVYASYFGPDNLPPLEAFSLGCPVICSRYRGAEEQLKTNALYFQPDNAQELADMIAKLQENSECRNQLIHKGKKQASARTPKDYTRTVLSLIDQFAATRKCWGDDFQKV